MQVNQVTSLGPLNDASARTLQIASLVDHVVVVGMPIVGK